MRQFFSRYSPLLVSALSLCVLVFILFPFYRYYVDPDGTSYLTISSRYAAGDFSRAINGLWSPWACWLTALLIKLGWEAVAAGCIINTLGAVGMLVGSFRLFLRFSFSRWQQWLFTAAIALFLVFAVYWQSFDDLWQCFFLLLILDVMLSREFSTSLGMWILAGFIGGIAYYSKAYSFQFLLLFFSVSYWFLSGRSWRQWLVMCAVSSFTLVLVALPWVFALHGKYHIWTTSTAGPLNMSWYLVGHPTWNSSVDILVPPPYSNSVYNWEDPWFANGALVGFTDSPELFLRQLLRIAYTGIMYLRCLAEVSIALPALAVFIVLRLVFPRRFRKLSANERLVFIFATLLPAGYLLVHIESRYLWSALPVYVVAFAAIAKRFGPSKIFQVAFAVSLLLFPAYQLVKLFNEGKQEFTVAAHLRDAGFTGVDIMSDLHPRLLSKICYFSANRFFVISRQKTDGVEEPGPVRLSNTSRLLADARRRGIRYYLRAPGKLKNPGFDELFYENLNDGKSAIGFEKVFEDRGTGYVLYKIPAQ